MDTTGIISSIDEQISKLQHAKSVLLGLGDTPAPAKAKRGRPKGSGKKSALPSKSKRITSTIEIEMPAAAERRWAAVKKAARKTK